MKGKETIMRNENNPEYCLRQSICLNYKEEGQIVCVGCYYNSIYLEIYQQKIKEDPDQLVTWECPMCMTIQKTKIQQGRVICPGCESHIWISLPNQYNICVAHR